MSDTNGTQLHLRHGLYACGTWLNKQTWLPRGRKLTSVFHSLSPPGQVRRMQDCHECVALSLYCNCTFKYFEVSLSVTRNVAVNDPSKIAHIGGVDSDGGAKDETGSIAQYTTIPSHFSM